MSAKGRLRTLRPLASNGSLTSDSGSMIPTVRTHSRKLSPSTQNYDIDNRPLLEPPALALASTARSRQDDVVFDNSRQPNFCSWLDSDLTATPDLRPLYPQVRTLRVAVPLVRR